jgi:predicted RNA-binding Zn ribbon-like protein
LFGSAAIALLNTWRGEGSDGLDRAWLDAHLRTWGISPSASVSDADLDALRDLRALLRRLTRTVSAGRLLSAKQLSAFNAVIGATPVRAALVRDGDRYAVEMTPVAVNWLDVTVREIAGSFSAMLRVDPGRLRLCAGACDTVFWDDTRSRTRIWCDSRTCGNRVRVSRHREAATSAVGEFLSDPGG